MADPNLSELVSSTLRKRTGTYADNVSKNNALFSRLQEKGMMDVVDGGRALTHELAYAEANFLRYSGFDTLDLSQIDQFSAAEFDPVQAAVPVLMDGRTARMNQGKAAMIKLATSRVDNADRTMSNNIANDIYSDGTLTNQIGGLQLLVADDPTTSTSVGGINQSTFSFWQNQVTEVTTPTSSNITAGMNALWLSCVRGSDQVDLITSDSTYFDFYETSLQAQQRWASAKSAAAGFDSLKYKNADVIFDGITGQPVGMYFLNTDFIQFQVYSGANFEPLGKRDSINQDATVDFLIMMGNLTTGNRSLQGRLKTA